MLSIARKKTSLDLVEARDDEVLGWQWHQLVSAYPGCPGKELVKREGVVVIIIKIC